MLYDNETKSLGILSVYSRENEYEFKKKKHDQGPIKGISIFSYYFLYFSCTYFEEKTITICKCKRSYGEMFQYNTMPLLYFINHKLILVLTSVGYGSP